MDIPQQQIINPGILDLTEKRQKKLNNYKKAVNRAGFLNNSEKSNWITLGYLLTDEQLAEAQQLIINEDLRRLKIRKQLNRIKPTIQ